MHDVWEYRPDPGHLQAGRFVFTVDNGRGRRLTFRIARPRRAVRDILFASVRTDTADAWPWAYVGVYEPADGTVRLTGGSRFAATDLEVRVLAFALRVIHGRQALPAGYALLPSARCACCGTRVATRTATVAGFAPACSQRLTQAA